MPDDLALDVLGGGVGTHIDAADVLTHDAQHDQNQPMGAPVLVKWLTII